MQDPDQAEVVFLRRDIRESFTYKLTEDIKQEHTKQASLVGTPVVVPLGDDWTVGIIVSVRSSADGGGNIDLNSLKPIKEAIRIIEPLPEELIQLGCWMARYYTCPINQVFRSILSPKYLPRVESGWKLSEQSDDSHPESLKPVDSGESMSRAELADQSDVPAEEFDDWFQGLVEHDLIERSMVKNDPEVRPRRYQYLELADNFNQFDRIKDDASKRQLELIQKLEKEGGIYRKELPEQLRRTSLINRLRTEEIVEVRMKVSLRDPFFSDGDTDTDDPGDLDLTPEQESVLSSIEPDLNREQFQSHLIHGVTGSGKTEVYFRLAQQALEKGKSVLVLVPEITLATFMVDRFRNRFESALAVLHSGLSAGERLDQWKRISNGEAQVVLGVQSAVLSPLRDLGLIVVDEEHDSSYKSGHSPRYNARDVAIMRAKINDIPVVLGSATPSLESYTNTRRGRYELHEMTNRPSGGALPDVLINDLRGEEGLLTQNLIDKTRSVLDDHKKAIWFLNRRGFSNFLLCENCGYVKTCERCNVSMTIHGSPGSLQCHYCGQKESPPDKCPDCGQPKLDSVGTGTEKLHEQASELFPEATIIRMDSDTVTRKEARYEKLNEFEQSDGVLLIGTQMVTKGLDFERVEYVAVVHADTGLQFPDFRSGERTFQQIVQVCGRAGRKNSDSLVHIQTYNPGHYAILYGKDRDFESFYEQELANRKPFRYPPFARLINIIARGEEERSVTQALKRLRDRIDVPENAEILGPSPCGLDYVKGSYRWHLLLRGAFSMEWRESLFNVIDEHNTSASIIVDTDPVDVM